MMDDWVFNTGGLFKGRRDRWKIHRYIPAGHMLHMFRVFLSFWEQDLLLAGWTSITPAGLLYTSRLSDLKAPTWSITLDFIFLLNQTFGYQRDMHSSAKS